ncbi:HNH endonuclease [Brachybacterium sacelli]|uniref:HNH nuclease domain-containing protein n=1 Tax=Brachybacterium sacelli TaxID=173364 RepID=A0ABS4X241_9MICO|nr:HNH endonuclease signature motif containing protein [Brachybacterium sacelli]MBP2382528.1 hypothetical protein [Brachybacterium sacelli]
MDEEVEGVNTEGARDRSAGSGDASPAADVASTPAGGRVSDLARLRGLVVAAGVGQLQVGEVDVSSATGVLAELGAKGSVSLDGLSAPETVDVLAGLRELSTAIAGVQARALVQLEAAAKADALARGERPRAALKVARKEASFALRASPSAAGQTMSSSRRLVQSMPGMLAAMAQGRISAAAAHRVGKVVAAASAGLRRQVDEVLIENLAYLEGCGVQEWAGEAERVMHALDPEGVMGRHLRARTTRGVTVRRGDHGMCTLTATVTALDGARIRKALSLGAEKARARGDGRGHQQIMADDFTDVLLGRGSGQLVTTMEIGVIITDRSLLAPGHADAATVEGIGSVPYEHVREEMLQAVTAAEEDPQLRVALRQLYTGPEDGQLVAVQARSRVFPPALSRFLRWSHLTCRAPYCDAPIRQNDHITPHSRGGETSLDNGNGLCAGDNQKEEAGVTARVVGDENGKRRSVEWTTRYGQKARRSGYNFDPLGTARRRRRAREQSAHEPADESDAQAGFASRSWTTWTLDDVFGPHGGEDGESPLYRGLRWIGRRAFEATDPHPAWRGVRLNRHHLPRGNIDYVFDDSQRPPRPT